MQIELKRLQGQLGITFIYITHDQEEALTMSDRIAVIRNGVFEQLGSAREVYSRPATSYVARFVGNANVLKREGRCFAIRSEHVEFREAGSAASVHTSRNGTHEYPARIAAVSFTGGQIRMTALLESGEEITSVRQGMDSSLKNGMEVLAFWEGENEIPLKDTD
jgi:spermidine/putrescine transport system ATP-binding protein